MMDVDPLFVVAIDFGTTYSGYSYCSKDDYLQDPPKVFANENWTASGQGLLSKKTPTCLLLTKDKEFCSFGYDAEDEYMSLALTDEHKDYYFFKRFKMKLHGMQEMTDDFMIEDEIGQPLPAIDVFSKSIAYLRGHFVDQLERKGIDIRENEIVWVLTVPAIWSDSSKSFMRKAAVQAGIKPNQLRIALEPEAASIFCQHQKTERKRDSSFSMSGPGTKYMVIDIGGGTADITVHEKLDGGKLGEVCKASGGPWGGTAVDQQYISLLTRIVGGPVMHRFRMEAMSEYLDMMREFEVTKRNIKTKGRTSAYVRLSAQLDAFCKQENDETVSEIISSPNFPFKGQIRRVADKLVISLEMMQELFKKVLGQIIEHVQSMLQQESTSDISLIILAGGLSESPFVQDYIKNALQTDERKVIVSEEAGVSVLKGAVMFGHSPQEVKSRMLRYTYGVRGKRPFNSKIHPAEKRKSAGGKDYFDEVFSIFVKMGTSVDEDSEIEKTFTYQNEQPNKALLVYVSTEPCPKSVYEKSCALLKDIDIGSMIPDVPLEKRKIRVTFKFGKTEVEIAVREEETGFKYNDTFGYGSHI